MKILKIISLVLICLISTSCSLTARDSSGAPIQPSLHAAAEKPKTSPDEKKNDFTQKSTPSVVTISPGHPRFVTFSLPSNEVQNYITCKGKRIPYSKISNSIGATYISESYFSPLQDYQCEIESFDKKKSYIKLKLVAYKYPEEKLNVDKKRVDLSKKDLDRVIKEKEILNKVYAESSPMFLFSDSFKKPLNSKLTSFYGNRRIFNNKQRTQHLGIDFRAPVGQKVPSANRGKVVLAQNLFFSGNTVIIDHGLGIFTMYGHLSEISAKVGTVVSKGEILGKAGMTGRVTGPHLHWGVKVHGNWIDGVELVKESKKQVEYMAKISQNNVL
ncbi:MAG: M23 family metallopeptidase [Halobacteriovoraceae bacterium]|nr:M23 family metallopeptidase [Halobacteriovoraceae bacterium]MCB9093971.1 M23 family metallopeptidase [Halobacteriovoraceae bacterium]